MTEQRKPQFPTFAEVKAAALRSIDRVLARWLPGGKLVDANKEYTAPNPTRADKRAGSLKVKMGKGTWCDFATGDKGGDLIDLVQYLDGCSHVDACNKLADFLGVTAGASRHQRQQARRARVGACAADPRRGHGQGPQDPPPARQAVQGMDLQGCAGPTADGAVPLR